MARLSRNQTRVRIAKDVLDLMAKNRIEPEKANYGKVQCPMPWGEEVVDGQAYYEGKRFCGCVLGSMFFAAVDRFNKLKLPAQDLWEPGKDTAVSYLKQFFTPEELDLLEAAFENTDQLADHVEDDAKVYRAANRFPKCMRAKERVYNLMQHIIRNKGELKLTRKVRAA